MLPLTHARGNENKLEKVSLTFSSSVGDFGRLFLCLNLVHRLLVSKVLYKASFYGDYRRIFGVILKLFARGMFLRGFTVSSYQRPLQWQRVNNGYSTMSDGIFDWIFPIVHRTFLLSYFTGCWLLDFFCAQSMWVYNEAAIELAAAVFFKRLQQRGHEFRDETKLLAKETL